MNETLDLIATRFSCRSFADKTVDCDSLRAIAKAGLQAPSAMNRQPWRIILIEDRAILDEIDAAGLAELKASNPASFERIQGRGGKLLYNAAALMLVVCEPIATSSYAQLDTGIVASHITLAAAALGVNSCIVGLPALAFKGETGAKLASDVGIPDGFEYGIGVLLGYATAPSQPHEIDPAKLIG